MPDGTASPAGGGSVLTPLTHVGMIRQLRLGRLRLRPDGSEIGPVRPGDL